MVAGPVTSELRGARQRLVEHLREQGIRDLAVLRAMESVPRHLFVPTGLRHRAYEDSALPIGNGQTISQPLIHAGALQLLELKGREKALEIGTGSGYQTALLAALVEQVFSVERIGALTRQAHAALQSLGIRNVSLLTGDGTLGWREYAPYDVIVVSAGGPDVPAPLLDQLSDGGRLVMPVGDLESQELMLYVKRGDRLEQHRAAPVRFVPLVGTHGWDSATGAKAPDDDEPSGPETV